MNIAKMKKLPLLCVCDKIAFQNNAYYSITNGEEHREIHPTIKRRLSGRSSGA